MKGGDEMFFETQERLEEIRMWFRRYDDHRERQYRKYAICRILNLVTSDEVGQLAKVDREILDLYYPRGMSPRQIASILIIRENEVPQYKTRALKRLRDILEAPRNDWHRIIITKAHPAGARSVSASADKIAERSTGDMLPVDVDAVQQTPIQRWHTHDATNSYREHRRILATIFADLSDEQVGRIPTRELDVLRLYFAGKTDEQIAQELGYAKITITQRKMQAKHRMRDISLGVIAQAAQAEVVACHKRRESDTPRRSEHHLLKLLRKKVRRPSRQYKPIEGGIDQNGSLNEDEVAAGHIPGVLKFRKYSSQEKSEIVSAFCADRANPLLRRKLVEAHLTTVRSVANICLRTVSRLAEFEDLVSLGIIGLLQAAEKYDPEKEHAANFNTFAAYYIKGAILDGFRAETDKASELRAAEGLRRKSKKVGLTPDEQKRLDKLQLLIWGTVELDAPLSDDGDTSLLDMLVSPAATPEQLLLEDEYRQEKNARNAKLEALIQALLEGLPYDQRSAVELRLIAGKSFSEIGKFLGYSESWASRLYHSGFSTVQAKVRAYGFSPLE
ncbi:sigma-70 family RNA polymerase sigma factor [Candidatus Uhrbacteria bacterium]|nr:sigma-70 family RNA polymerase sigma factor [Candidatus Uhrbacteria bacterium]